MCGDISINISVCMNANQILIWQIVNFPKNSKNMNCHIVVLPSVIVITNMSCRRYQWEWIISISTLVPI